MKLLSTFLLTTLAPLTLALATPQINEFLSINGGPITDEDGDEVDWIEIKNTGAAAMDLAGWHLTDDAAALTKWTFPSVSIPAGGFLLVFASDKDRAAGGSELHLNFKLSSDGEYLALVEPDGVTVASEYPPGFPAQLNGISYGLGGDGSIGYFTTPSPGGENPMEALAGFIEEPVEFSHNRGFYEAPFDLSLTTAAGGVDIFYTLDGSEPSRSNGTLYSGAIEVATTSIVRAAAFTESEGSLHSNTSTFIFLDDVLDQPDNPPGFPSTWQPGISADYGFDRGVATDGQLKTALRSLPTVSLVMAIDDWFNPSSDPAVGGIYSNSVNGRGFEWERPISAEFFDFPHGQEVQVNCGIRIFGNASRQTSREKHNMRLIFRSSYGPAKLEFPLFGGDAEPDVVNGYLMRGQNGDSWFHPSSGQRQEALYIRDQLARDLQKEMGQPSTKQDHAHVYINGLYWGVMNTIERIEAESHVQAFGGKKEDWDSLKSSRTPSSAMYAVDGTLDAWNEMLAIAEAGLEAPEDYAAIQQVLDLDNFIDFLLINFYNGNNDWDDNNFQCAKRRVPGDKWRFFVWDSERTLLGTSVNNTTRDHATRATRVHTRLRANAEYRLKFADRMHRHMFNDGALTPDGVRRLFNQWVDFLRVPLRAESARWGDAERTGNPYTVEDEWQTEVNFQNNTYMAGRTNTVFNQLKSLGLYPDTAAPSFNRHGGGVDGGFQLTMSAPAGVIYYTLDGSDPRVPATTGEVITVVDEFVPATAFLPSDDSLGSSWQEVTFDDSGWLQGATAVGFEALPDHYDPLLNLKLPEMQNQHPSAYVRVPFTIADQAALDEIGILTLNVKYEDGFVCYLNGVRVADSGNFPEPPRFDTDSDSRSDTLALDYQAFDLSGEVGNLRIGKNVLAFQLMNSSAANSDLLLMPQLIAQSASASGVSPTARVYSGGVQLDHSVRANARVLQNGEWSALNSAAFFVDTVPADASNLAITELQYHPANDDDGLEFVELTNISNQPIDLSGLSFSAGLSFDFDLDSQMAVPVLAGGDRLVIVGNQADFQTAYPSTGIVAGAFRGDLSNDGERISLQDRDGQTIREFTYSDRAPWPEAADGSGPSLMLISPRSNPDHALPGNWRASPLPGGNPSLPPTSFAAGDVTLLEYAAPSLPKIENNADGGDFHFSFQGNPSAEDVSYTVESSTDLRSWLADDSLDLIRFDAAGNVTYSGRSDAEPQHFFRLRITLSAPE